MLWVLGISVVFFVLWVFQAHPDVEAVCYTEKEREQSALETAVGFVALVFTVLVLVGTAAFITMLR